MRTALLLSLVVAAACATSNPPSRSADITGIITNIAPGASSILIEERPQDTSGSAKVSVRIDGNTRIWGMTGSRATLIQAGELRIGAIARAWFDGPVAESYPAQAKASDIAIDTMTMAGDLFLLSKGGPVVVVRVNGIDSVRLVCNGGDKITPGSGGVPALPWQVEVVRERDGRVLLSQRVTELPGWLMVQPDTSGISRAPILGPFVPCS